MKKLILAAAVAVAATLVVTGCAGSSGQSSTASDSSQAASSSEVASSAEGSTYDIELTVPEGLEGEWRTDDPETQENNIVKLVSSEMQDGVFVASYEAVNDGTTSVNLKHYSGVACDMLYTYILTVENGQISEEGVPVEVASPDAAALDPFVSGEWIEDADQAAALTIEASSEGGWSAQVVTPASQGAHIYKMTLYYDCDLQKLVYDDGALYEAPITDSDDEEELGEPVATDQQGFIEVASTDEGNVALYWNSEANSEGRDITFVRTNGAAASYADFEAITLGGGDVASAADDGQNPVMNFVGPYASDRASMQVEASGESDAKITVTWGSSANETTEWVMTGAFDVDKFTVTYSDAVKTNYVYNEDGSVKSQEVEYADGSGRFIFYDDPLSCTWQNENEPDNGPVEFTWSF